MPDHYTGGGYSIKSPTYGRTGNINVAIDNPNAAANWDYITGALDSDTEGVYEEAAIKESMLSGFLGNIAESTKSIEEKTVMLADMLRNTQSSSDVVEQILGIPKEEINAYLTAGGFGPRGEKLESTAEYLGLEGTLGTLAGYPAAVDNNSTLVEEPVSDGGGSLPSDPSQVAAANVAAAEDLTAASTDLLDGDPALTGSTTVADTIEPASPAGLTVGDIVTDDRITGDLEFIYDADSNLFHYVPFDINGNRVYTGETLAASDVIGFDSTGVETGQTIGVYPDAATGKMVLEHTGTDVVNTVATEDTTDNSLIDISIGGLINGGGLLSGQAGPVQGKGGGPDSGGLEPDGGGPDSGGLGPDGGKGPDGGTGLDGLDGLNGLDGLDGSDGRDGKDGKTGLALVGMLSSPIANEIFKTEFKDNYLRPQYVDRILRGRS